MSTIQLVATLIKAAAVFGACLGSVAVLVYLERRVSAFIQLRYRRTGSSSSWPRSWPWRRASW